MGSRPRLVLKFSINSASKEWGIGREALARALTIAKEDPDKEGKYTLKQIDRAIHGSLEEQQIRLTSEKADIAAIEKSQLLKETAPMFLVQQVWTRVLLEYRQRVVSATIPDAVRKHLLEPLTDPAVDEYFETNKQIIEG